MAGQRVLHVVRLYDDTKMLYFYNKIGGGVKNYYTKRLHRLGVPLLIWSLFYAIVNHGASDGSIFHLIYNVFTFKVNPYMWFFVPLIIIYISMPFLSVFVMNAPKHLLDIFMIVGIILPVINSILLPTSTGSSYAVFCTPYIYFVVAGYYIGTIGISQKQRKLLYGTAFLSAVIILVGTYWLSLNMPEHYRCFLSYTSLPCTITALGVFTLFVYADWKQILGFLRLSPKTLSYFSTLSLGIYLIQAFWFRVLGHIHLCDNTPLIRFIIMYVLCVVSVGVMKYMPFIKKIV